MSFVKLFEDFDTDINIEIYKFLKKKGIKKPVHYKEEFKETKTFPFRFKGSNFKLYINDKDFSSDVYDFEWI